MFMFRIKRCQVSDYLQITLTIFLFNCKELTDNSSSEWQELKISSKTFEFLFTTPIIPSSLSPLQMLKFIFCSVWLFWVQISLTIELPNCKKLTDNSSNEWQQLKMSSKSPSSGVKPCKCKRLNGKFLFMFRLPLTLQKSRLRWTHFFKIKFRNSAGKVAFFKIILFHNDLSWQMALILLESWPHWIRSFGPI